MAQTTSVRYRNRVIKFYGFLSLLNIGSWSWAWIAFHNNPLSLGTAVLAYTLGLRHAVDADHIAAIDNVTRKLVQEGKRPVSVGFFFSLGHSTVVILISVIVYLAATAFESQLSTMKEIGGMLGTLISVLFLFAIALVNCVILFGIWRTLRRAPKSDRFASQTPEMLLGGGFLARIFKPLFRTISQPWHMYPIGFLFGLGFDTATEVAILGISAAAAAKGLTLSSMAVFPVLFTAGMTLIDTTDGILMTGAYGWACIDPVRKLYYNLTMTFISVVVALVVGGIEAIGLLKDQLHLTGPIWDLVENLNDNFGTLGFVIIGLFLLSWLGSAVVYRVKGFNRLESSSTPLD